MIEAVILAAGLSSRMESKNKLLLDLKGKTILEHVVDSVLSSSVEKVIVVLGHQHQRVVGSLERYNVEFIINPVYRKGMTSSIQASMSLLSSACTGFMICLGDMPLLEAKDYDFLIDHFKSFQVKDKKPIVRPVFKNSVGNPVIFDRSYLNEILLTDSKEGCRNVIEQNKNHFYPVPVTHLKYFYDVDNLNDYNRLLLSSDE